MPDVTTANLHPTATPDRDRGGSNAWVLCDRCHAVVYRKRWIKLDLVCPECGHHGRLDAAARLRQLTDPGSAEPIGLPRAEDEDPLTFVDRLPYPVRLSRAREATGLTDAVVVARAEIDAVPAVVAVMDFGFLGGSLGAAAGDALIRSAEEALTRRLPYVVVTASGGARMQEGAISLMQMARTATAWTKLRESGLLTVTVVSDPTYGGVAASFASLSDVVVGEKGARLGLAGRRVIEQTIRERLPADFQTVEFMLARGFVDVVVARHGLRDLLGRLLRCAGAARAPQPGDGRAALPDRDGHDGQVLHDPDALPVREAGRQVRLARELSRPTLLDYLNLAFDEYVELHGDRSGGDCPAMITALARLRGRSVVLIGQQKGHTAAELAERNFGMPSPAGYRKAARAMRLAAVLRLPVVTLVDTPGAFPGAAAEEQGQASAIAENLQLMMSLPVPVVSVVTGEGGSGGALGIAVANRVLAWQNAVYSVISPEGCASILWGDPAQAPVAAAALKLTARDLLEIGVLDGVLLEPGGDAGADPLAAADRLAVAVSCLLAELGALDADQLIKDRRRRFGRFGAPDQD